jgi:ribosomal protein S24E
MNTIQDLDNRLLQRREIKLAVQMQSNPGFTKAAEVIASHFKSNAENVVVKTIESKFGRDTFLIDAFVYDSLDDKNRVERKKKVKKDKK